MKCILINPNIVAQINDFSGTGIPYLPIGLAYLSSYLRKLGFIVKVIDAFGEAPTQITKSGNKFVQGLSAEQVLKLIPEDADVFLIYAHLAVTFQAQIDLIKSIKNKFKSVPLIILENINKVNSYSLLSVKNLYLEAGVEYLVLGYLEHRTARVLKMLASKNNSFRDKEKIPGLVFKSGSDYVMNPGLSEDWGIKLDALPFPAWDLFPMKNYWNIKYSHAPFTQDRYLTLLSSRGCPYNCFFCTTCGMESNKRWNSRSPENLVDEIITFKKKFNVNEFHFEDLNPGINKRRIIRFCYELKKREANIEWKFAQGTKLEALNEEVIELMAETGCRYISISPESGSKKILKIINKKVDLEHSIKVVFWMKKYNIISQCCFIIGVPNETKKDLRLTRKHLLKLAKIGLDDPAIFIVTPMPGSFFAEKYSNNIPMLDDCTFTPVWRKDYYSLSKFRKIVYFEYLLIKIIYHPKAFLNYIINFFSRRFKTKVEMTLYRKIYSLIILLKGSIK